MTPYKVVKPSDYDPKWRLMDHYDEETGETYWELCAAIIRYNKDTFEKGIVPISIPKVEADLMSEEELDKLQKRMIREAVELLEQDGYNQRYRPPWCSGMK